LAAPELTGPCHGLTGRAGAGRAAPEL